MAYNSAYTGAQHDAYVTKESLINLIYPVGAIYISTNSTSPQTLFGGTWQQIQDTFLLAAGSTYTAGDTGGNATHTHGYAHTHTTPATTTDSHTLTIAEMPSHMHQFGMVKWNSNGTDAGPMYSMPSTYSETGGTSYSRPSGTSGTSTYNSKGNTRIWNEGGGAAIPTGKRLPQQIHKVLQRQIRVQVYLRIQPFTSGSVPHKVVRYTNNGGVTYGL